MKKNTKKGSLEKKYEAMERIRAILAVHLILPAYDGNILMMLRKDTGYMDGFWDLPSGHLERGELPRRAIVREAKEEVGVTVSQLNLELVHSSYQTAYDKSGDRINLVFLAKRWNKKPRICEPEKCAEIRWFGWKSLPKKTVPQVKEFIRGWKKKVNFSEFNLDWLKNKGVLKL